MFLLGSFHFKIILRSCVNPRFTVQISILNEQLREVSAHIIVDYVCGLCALPGLHIAVVFVDCDEFANRALPVVSGETWECWLEIGEYLECLCGS
jgi:hypothetical protein